MKDFGPSLPKQLLCHLLPAVLCPVPEIGESAKILMLGDAIDDRMAMSGAKWLHRQGCHVMAMSPDKKDYGHHNYPLERFGKAIEEYPKECRETRRDIDRKLQQGFRRW